MNWDNVDTYNGSNAIQVAVTFTSETQSELIGLNLGTPVNLPTGSVISLYYEVVGTPNPNGQIVISGTTGGTTGAWQNSLAGTYTQEAVTLASNATGVSQIGFQLLYGGTPNAGGPEAVTVNIAAVTITVNMSGTPTPVPGYSWTWTDGLADYWSSVYPATGASAAATSLSAAGVTSCGDSSLYALDITFMPTSSNNDIQTQVGGPTSGTPPPPVFPLNFVTLGATGVRCNVMVLPDAYSVSTSEYIGGALYVTSTAYGSSTSDADIFGGTYEGWTGGGSPTNLDAYPADTCIPLNITPTGGNWTTDETSIAAIGVDFNMSTANMPTQADFLVDNVVIY